ncbi:hypothetical protein ACFL0D_07400 [Thermoproteota archaeon]
MGIVLKSEWMIPRIETLKILHNLCNEKYNEDLESIEFTDKGKTKILLVVANEKGKTGNVDLNLARKIKSFVEETEFNEIFVLGETQTSTAYEILKHNEKTTIITSNARIQLKENEILNAFYHRAYEMCEIECDKKPQQRNDCKATKKDALSCQIRTLIDNAEFHARMGWKDQLLNDFSILIDLKLSLDN